MDLVRFLGIVLRWSWLILLLALAAGVTSYVVAQAQPRAYDSEAIVLVGSLTDTDLQQQLAYQQLAQTYATMATTSPVLARVNARMRLTSEPDDLRSRIRVRTRPGQSFLLVEATAGSSLEAADLANAVADEITAFARSATGEPGFANVVQPAVEPSGAASPNVLLSTAIAVVLGMLAGLALALGFTNRTRRPVSA